MSVLTHTAHPTSKFRIECLTLKWSEQNPNFDLVCEVSVLDQTLALTLALTLTRCYHRRITSIYT